MKIGHFGTVRRFRIADMREYGRLMRHGRREAERWLRDPSSGLLLPNSSLIAFRNTVIDSAQEELLKRWRYLSGSSRQIRYIAVGSGYTDPAVTDTALTTPLDSKEITEAWDDSLLPMDSTGLSIMTASVFWLAAEAVGTIAEIGFEFDDATLATHALFKKLDITAATKANPVQITTSTAHGLATGDEVHIDNVGGMTEINNRDFVITVVDSTNFSLDGEDGTGHTTYTSGGNAWLIVTKSSSEVVQTDYSLSLTS